jgi:hypothetical protein
MSASKRYPLLLYREWMRPFPLPIVSVAVVLVLLWISGLFKIFPGESGLSDAARNPLLGIAAAILFGLWAAVKILPHLAYVQCQPEYLLLRAGVLRLIVSYSRLRTSRSVLHAQIHTPKTQPRSRRALAAKMALKQCVAIELTSYPMAFFLLRALTHPFLYLGTQPGFLFAVEDWMSLSREVEERHAAWLAKRKDAGKQPRLGALS